MKDDGIKFQWGDRYIKSEEVTDVGGKYWKWNEDGSITQFDPPGLRFRKIQTGIVNDIINPTDNFKLISDNKIEFGDESIARHFENTFNSNFWAMKEIEPIREGRVIDFKIGKTTLEDTYTPSTGE